MNLEEKLQKNAEVGADLVLKALEGKSDMNDRVKLASMAITQHCKHIATKGAIDTIKFAVGRSIAANQDELKKYVHANLPEYNPVKQLK